MGKIEKEINMNQESIIKLIKKCKLESIQNNLLKAARDCIIITTEKKDGYSNIGNSRFGGYPDLPENFDYPENIDDEKMTFIAQLNLQEICQLGINTHLPNSGMLYFFLGNDHDGASDIDNYVIYCDVHQSKLNTLHPDEEDIFVLNEERDFTPYKLNLSSGIDFPGYGSYEFDHLGLDKDNMDSYLDFYEKLKKAEQQSKIHGYYEDVNGAVAIGTAMAYYNLGWTSYINEQTQKLMKHLKTDEKGVQKELEKFVLLLEVDSHMDVGFSWWDDGKLQFIIHKNDLAKKDFSKVYANIETG